MDGWVLSFVWFENHHGRDMIMFVSSPRSKMAGNTRLQIGGRRSKLSLCSWRGLEACYTKFSYQESRPSYSVHRTQGFAKIILPHVDISD